MWTVAGGATLCQVCVDAFVVVIDSHRQDALCVVLTDHVAVEIVIDLEKQSLSGDALCRDPSES